MLSPIAEQCMRTTRIRRAKYVAAILLITGLAACSFPIVTRAKSWHRAFADDHDAEFLLNGVTDGFRYTFFDPEPHGPFFQGPQLRTGSGKTDFAPPLQAYWH